MSPPLIGLTCKYNRKEYPYYRLDERYSDAVRDAGGIPLLITLARDDQEACELVGRLDGVFLTGGGDLDADLWGEANHPLAKLSDRGKQLSDLAVARCALLTDTPLLGICLGCQVINVALGGSLHQHLPDLTDTDHANGAVHPVTIRPGTRIAAIMGEGELMVNSHHHQSVARLGDGLVATSHSEDGLIESIELPAHSFAVGIQWHPERMADRREQAAVFSEFVAEARRARERAGAGIGGRR